MNYFKRPVVDNCIARAKQKTQKKKPIARIVFENKAIGIFLFFLNFFSRFFHGAEFPDRNT